MKKAKLKALSELTKDMDKLALSRFKKPKEDKEDKKDKPSCGESLIIRLAKIKGKK